MSSGWALQGNANLIDAKRIILIGCGTSWHAALVGEYLLEDLARIPVEVEYASEFRYRNPIIYKTILLLQIAKVGKPQTHWQQ
jgi:glucosamine--fructose-6-phosphate aminotransferase (isomerizing)